MLHNTNTSIGIGKDLSLGISLGSLHGADKRNHCKGSTPFPAIHRHFPLASSISLDIAPQNSRKAWSTFSSSLKSITNLLKL